MDTTVPVHNRTSENLLSPTPLIKKSTLDSPGSPTDGFTKLEVITCQHKQSVMIDRAKNFHYGCRKCFSIEVLQNAMLNRNTKSFIDLIRRYKHMSELTDPRGYTPFLISVEMDDIDTMVSLKKLYDINARTKCNDGNSAIHIAAMFGRWNAIKRLLLRFEFRIDELNDNGETPLKVAVNFKQDKLITILVKKLKVKVPTDLMEYVNTLV
eukprot:g4455.t1